jgi:hypothetical protein
MATQITQSDTHGLFILGIHERYVYITTHASGPSEVRDRIVNAIALVHVTVLGKLWVELEYRLDICRISRDSNIEHT